MTDEQYGEKIDCIIDATVTLMKDCRLIGVTEPSRARLKAAELWCVLERLSGAMNATTIGYRPDSSPAFDWDAHADERIASARAVMEIK